MLILSEFAGAAQSLGAGALQVNPWNISEVADAIHKALTMDEKERKERTDYCFQVSSTLTDDSLTLPTLLTSTLTQLFADCCFVVLL